MISLLVPSRGRPVIAREMWESANITADDPENLELVLYLDDDDETALDTAVKVGTAYSKNVKIVHGPRTLLSETWNKCAERASHDVLWHGNDDVLFRSKGWDTHVRNAFNGQFHRDNIILVHGNDLVHGERLATLGFYHKDWVEALGYLVPPYFSSDYNDVWNTEIADAIGRRVYLPSVVTEHMHFSVGKSNMDQTYADRLARHRQDGVDQIYSELSGTRLADVERLRLAIRRRGSV